MKLEIEKELEDITSNRESSHADITKNLNWFSIVLYSAGRYHAGTEENYTE